MNLPQVQITKNPEAKHPFCIGIAQYALAEQPSENLGHALACIHELARAGAELVLLPELYQSRYFCETENYEAFSLAEKTDSKAFAQLKDCCTSLNIHLMVPYFEERTKGLYHNSLALLNPEGKMAGHYRKTHIPDDPGYYEKFYFTPGDTGFQAMPLEGHPSKPRIGTLICWDQWFPEGARATTLLGADLLYFPTAIGWHQSQDEKTNKTQFEAWRAVQRGHAIANGVFTAAVNRVGREGEMQFWGGSFVYGPFGELIWDGPLEKEALAIVELDLSEITKTRQHWPFLRDRRPEAYKGIGKQFGR